MRRSSSPADRIFPASSRHLEERRCPKSVAAQCAAADVAIEASKNVTQQDTKEAQDAILEETRKIRVAAERSAEQTYNLATDPTARKGLWVAVAALVVSTLLGIPAAINESRKLLDEVIIPMFSGWHSDGVVSPAIHLVGGNESFVTSLGMMFPLLGVAFSWWSFKWSEEGATPDNYYDPSPNTDLEGEIIQHGIRERARACAKATFNIGALLIAAGVPMGAAAQHASDAINGFALVGYAIVAFGIGYGLRQTVAIWRSRRANAFSCYYDNNTMPRYYDREKTAAIFYRINPMPIWSLPDRRWFTKLRTPNIDEVSRCASLPIGESQKNQKPLF